MHTIIIIQERWRRRAVLVCGHFGCCCCCTFLIDWHQMQEKNTHTTTHAPQMLMELNFLAVILHRHGTFWRVLNVQIHPAHLLHKFMGNWFAIFTDFDIFNTPDEKIAEKNRSAASYVLLLRYDHLKKKTLLVSSPSPLDCHLFIAQSKIQSGGLTMDTLLSDFILFLVKY